MGHIWLILVLYQLMTWQTEARRLPNTEIKSPEVQTGLFANISSLALHKEEFHYKSNLELEEYLTAFSARCINISRLYSIGRSVQGVPLWALEISDNPGLEEPKPAFKYIGNLHGDEPIGRELLLLLADWLCENYLKDHLAALIVKEVHLHLVPSINPDGFRLKRRGNANNVDLNRDFPDQFFTQNDDESKRQPETRAIMRWTKKNRFVAAASLHEGAVVANYPWDGTSDASTKYSECPDDSTFRYLASLYSSAHKRMFKSKEFPGGITNGAAWYPLYGGMQDWNYIHGGCFDLTLEVSDAKWPPPQQIFEIWEENRLSMLELVASVVKSGVHGRVLSSATNHGLSASIHVDGFKHTVVSGAVFGDFHRLLPPGKAYNVTVSMPGHINKTTRVFLPKNSSVFLEFILEPMVTYQPKTEEDQKATKSMVGEITMSRELQLEKISRTDDDLFSDITFFHLKISTVCFLVSLFLAILYMMVRGKLKFSRLSSLK